MCLYNLLEFLCSECESGFVHGCPEGVQSGVAGAAPDIPWSPLLPLLQHGIQVAPGSISIESRLGLDDGDLIGREAEALSNPLPLVSIAL